MKKLKKIVFLILPITLVFFSCKKNDEINPKIPNADLKVSATEIKDSYESFKQSFQVTSSLPWEIKSLPDWIELDTRDGFGNNVPADINVTVSENGTVVKRTAELTIESVGVSGKITVTQGAAPIIVSKSEVSNSKDAFNETIVISVPQGNSWTLGTPSASWFTVEKSGSSEVIITAEKNTDIYGREGTFEVTSNGVTLTVTIKQEGNSELVNNSLWQRIHINDDLVQTSFNSDSSEITFHQIEAPHTINFTMTEIYQQIVVPVDGEYIFKINVNSNNTQEAPKNSGGWWFAAYVGTSPVPADKEYKDHMIWGAESDCLNPDELFPLNTNVSLGDYNCLGGSGNPVSLTKGAAYIVITGGAWGLSNGSNLGQIKASDISLTLKK